MPRPWLAAGLIACAAAAAAVPVPPFQVVKHLSLETRTTAPSFVCLDGITLLDRGRLLHIGRPLEDRSVLRVLDLASLQIHDLRVPGIPGPMSVPPKQLAVDKPLYYDTANGTAGILLRGGASVSGDAAYAEWDLGTNRVVRTLPLAPGAGAYWTSVNAIGYDPGRREAYVEVVRCRGGGNLPCKPGGPFDWAVLAVTDRVRTVATWTGPLKPTQKEPYYDPIHHRSMHIEYAECGAEQTTAHLVDLDAGTVKPVALPRVIYGFAFDPDGRTGYVYSYTTRQVFALDLETGRIGRRATFGNVGHLLEFVAPGTLLLGRDPGMHFIDARTLRETGFLPTAAFHRGSPHLEGSVFMPGRAIVRNYSDLYVIDLPGLAPPTESPSR